MRSFRVTNRGYRRVTFLAVAALSAIIVSGGAVRLTDSGLGCPDWPTCSRHSFVAPWQYHAVVEFANRCFTGLVVAAVVLAVAGALMRRPRRRDLVALSLGLVAGVVAQIILGGLTVLFKLAPPFVMAHFLLSIALLWDAVVLHHRAGQPPTAPQRVVGREIVWLGRLIMAVTAAVIVMGTVVTGAGPHAGNAQTPRLGVSFRSVAEVHASIVMLLLGLTLASLFALHVARAPRRVQRAGGVMLGVMAAQAVVGYAQYFTKVPALAVGIHIAGATAVWIAVVQFNLFLHARPREQQAGSGQHPSRTPEEVLATT